MLIVEGRGRKGVFDNSPELVSVRDIDDVVHCSSGFQRACFRDGGREDEGCGGEAE